MAYIGYCPHNSRSDTHPKQKKVTDKVGDSQTLSSLRSKTKAICRVSIKANNIAASNNNQQTKKKQYLFQHKYYIKRKKKYFVVSSASLLDPPTGAPWGLLRH